MGHIPIPEVNLTERQGDLDHDDEHRESQPHGDHKITALPSLDWWTGSHTAGSHRDFALHQPENGSLVLTIGRETPRFQNCRAAFGFETFNRHY